MGNDGTNATVYEEVRFEGNPGSTNTLATLYQVINPNGSASSTFNGQVANATDSDFNTIRDNIFNAINATTTVISSGVPSTVNTGWSVIQNSNPTPSRFEITSAQNIMVNGNTARGIWGVIVDNEGVASQFQGNIAFGTGIQSLTAMVYNATVSQAGITAAPMLSVGRGLYQRISLNGFLEDWDQIGARTYADYTTGAQYGASGMTTGESPVRSYLTITPTFGGTFYRVFLPTGEEIRTGTNASATTVVASRTY